MTSRVYTMTDDRGVKDMLQFHLARDTYHQQRWLLGIEQLIADGFVEHGIENSHDEDEKDGPNRTFYSFDPASTPGEGRWAQGPSLIDPEKELVYVASRAPAPARTPGGRERRQQDQGCARLIPVPVENASPRRTGSPAAAGGTNPV
jgi:Mn-containing catalase